MARPPLHDRLAAAPVPLRVEAVLLALTPLALGLHGTGYAADDIRAWAGVGGGLLLGIGLVAQWRIAWAFALLVDAIVGVAGLGTLPVDSVGGALMVGRGLLGMTLLLLPSTGAHVFGRAPYGSWFDEVDEPKATE